MSEDLTMYPVSLSGAKVAIREFRADDEDAMLAIAGDDRVTQGLSYDSRTPEQVQVMLSDAIQRARSNPRPDYYLAIVLPPAGQLIGFTRIGLAGVRAGKLGYALRRDQWGKGYATDATQTMITFGFQDLGLHRISAAIDPTNTSSIAVVKRLGFQREGRIRDHVHTNGTWRDSLLYSLLSHEWPISKDMHEMSQETRTA